MGDGATLTRYGLMGEEVAAMSIRTRRRTTPRASRRPCSAQGERSRLNEVRASRRTDTRDCGDANAAHLHEAHKRLGL